VVNKQSDTAMNVNQQLCEYINGTGGAYILIENHPAVPMSFNGDFTITQGPILSEILYNVAPNITQLIRLINDPDGMNDELENMFEMYHIATLPVEIELITRFTTDLKTNNTFYDDDSGFEMHPRVYDSTLGIAGNYHPLVSSGYIRSISDDRQFTAVTHQSMGIASLQDGQIELMLHRRTLANDAQGPWPLNDSTTIEIPLRFIVDSQQNSEILRQKLRLNLEYPFQLLFGVTDSITNWIEGYVATFSPMSQDLPANVHLLTLQRSNEEIPDETVIRFEHMYEKDVPVLSSNVSLTMQEVFNSIKIGQVKEKTLSLQQDENKLHRTKWNPQSATDIQYPIIEEDEQEEEMPEPDLTQFTLSSCQIRTFSVRVSHPSE